MSNQAIFNLNSRHSLEEGSTMKPMAIRKSKPLPWFWIILIALAGTFIIVNVFPKSCQAIPEIALGIFGFTVILVGMRRGNRGFLRNSQDFAAGALLALVFLWFAYGIISKGVPSSPVPLSCF